MLIVYVINQGQHILKKKSSKAEDIRKSSPQGIARKIIKQKIDLDDMETVFAEMPEQLIQRPYVPDTSYVPMEIFVTEMLPRLKHRGDFYDDLWLALENVAGNKPLGADDKKALKEAPALLGQLMVNRKNTIANLHVEYGSVESIENKALAFAEARAHTKALSKTKLKTAPEAKVTAGDYKRAVGFVKKIQKELVDNSPDVLLELQLDIRAMNKALGLDGPGRG